MKNLNQVNNLSELLAVLSDESQTMFINLCSRCGSEHSLMDQIVSNIQKEYGESLGYHKLPPVASKIIKEELMVSKNPILLLIKDGEIKALFGGIIAQFKLEKALEKLKSDKKSA